MAGPNDDNVDLSLSYEIIIESITPNYGGILGGTLLTIKGKNFGEKKN